MNMNEALEEFLVEKAASGISIRSVNAYRRTLRLFVRSIGSDLDVSELTWGIVQRHLKSLWNGHLAHATARSYTKDIKIFIRWLDGEFRLPFSAAKIKIPKAHKKHVQIYSIAEIELIFKACETYIPFVTARNQAIVAIMLDCGLRREEVTKIRLSDIRVNEDGKKLISVHGKGDKDRIVPFNRFAQLKVKEYTDLCPYPICDYLFLTKTGTPITNDTISQTFADIQAKLPFALSAHKLRHNYATNFCLHSLNTQGHVDLFTLSILLGHEDITTTRIYEHVAREQLVAGNAYSFMDENFMCEKKYV